MARLVNHAIANCLTFVTLGQRRRIRHPGTAHRRGNRSQGDERNDEDKREEYSTT